MQFRREQDMKPPIRLAVLIIALGFSSAARADEVLYPPWNGWDHWRDGDATVGWDYGYETGTAADATVVVNLVASVVGVAWTNQWCWNYESWTAPADDYYRFTFNYNATGWASLSGASLFGDASWITMKVVLRVVPSWTTWEEGPYYYNYWRCVAATSGIPYIPLPPYEYDENVQVTTPPIWFDEGDTVSIGGGIQIEPFALCAIGFVGIVSENTGQLNSVQIVRENPPNPILAVDPDPPAHVFGQQTRLEPVEWTFNIWNSGTGTLNWDVSSNSEWISLSPESGISTGEWDAVTVTVDTASLTLGDHGGFINITTHDPDVGSDLGFIGITIINVPPGADAGGPYNGTVGEAILFDASNSVDADGAITGYRWDWDNNGTWDTGWLGTPTTTHSFATSGSHTVALQVRDNDDDTGTDTCVCNVSVLTALVKPDGTGDFPTIQAAINAAANGAVILLANGTFTGTGNRDIDYLGKAITVRSQSDNPSACIIDCQGSTSAPHRGFYFHSNETRAAVLRGVTIRNGYAATGLPGLAYHGGGVLCYPGSPTIVNAVFLNNTAQEGGSGGLGAFGDSSPAVSYSTFAQNTGAIRCQVVDVTNIPVTCCSFYGNSSSAISVNDNAMTITDCEFQGPGGGAIAAGQGARVYVNGCTAVGFGGPAVSLRGPGGTNDGHAFVSHCTFLNNHYGVWGEVSGTLQMEASIVAFSTYAGVSCGSGGGVEATLSCCDLYGNYGGDWVGCIADQLGVDGNICADPLLCNPAYGDYRLYDVSPCAPAQQPSCGKIGAYDVGCLAEDCNGNGVPDYVDIMQGTSRDCQPNGVPDECDIASGTSVDCQPNGIPDECDLSPTPDGSLMARWSFDDGTATDTSGHGRDGIVHGAVAVPGRFGDAFEFDGVDDWIEIPDSVDMEYPTMTVCAWLRCDGTQGGERGILTKHYGENSAYMLERWGTNGAFWVGHGGGGGTDRLICGEVNVADGEWHHVCGVYGGEPTMAVYIDGEFCLGVSGPLMAHCECDVAIGIMRPYPFYFKGAIDDVRIYSRVLGDAEIESIYQGTDGGSADVNENGIPDECEAPGDLNADGHVDAEDFELFVDCLAGPGEPNPGCDPVHFARADLDGDGDVDLADFADFQRVFTGP